LFTTQGPMSAAKGKPTLAVTVNQTSDWSDQNGEIHLKNPGERRVAEEILGNPCRGPVGLSGWLSIGVVRPD
ncbi:MAG: hypothetical protein KDA81_15515, partial [Planctomycetaceae bacterium]|nr:hypothetical protein [Planctomycetaceae bacterium]